MSEVKKSRMKPRLGQLMSQKGGMYVAEALKRADATLETLREPSLSGIDDYITALDNLLIAEIDNALRIEALCPGRRHRQPQRRRAQRRRPAGRPLAVRPAGRGQRADPDRPGWRQGSRRLDQAAAPR
jgi:hypothetical protein